MIGSAFRTLAVKTAPAAPAAATLAAAAAAAAGSGRLGLDLGDSPATWAVGAPMVTAKPAAGPRVDRPTGQ
jgi:hypothetical protein